MIEDFLTWVQLLSLAVQQNQAVTSPSQSNFIFIAYLITLRKSYLFGAAFLFCETVGMLDIIPQSLSTPIYGLTFCCATLLSWLSVAGLHIYKTDNKDTLTACVIMILLLLIMAMDSYVNAYNETLIWRNYENIILCIHVCIILSLYQSRTIIDSMVDKFHHFVNMLRNNYACSYFWYTVKNRQKQKRL
ncbi:MAG TPA: hypothetical protein DDW91_06835 [Shewanella frigidimarina]|nr:hypothetical protein [Shewanella frigidimarina]